jgi:hypothetical protein
MYAKMPPELFQSPSTLAKSDLRLAGQRLCHDYIAARYSSKILKSIFQQKCLQDYRRRTRPRKRELLANRSLAKALFGCLGALLDFGSLIILSLSHCNF